MDKDEQETTCTNKELRFLATAFSKFEHAKAHKSVFLLITLTGFKKTW